VTPESNMNTGQMTDDDLLEQMAVEFPNCEAAIVVHLHPLSALLSHGYGPPLLWESRVFGTLLDGDGRRYTTRQEALRGHAELVERVRQAYAREQRGQGGIPNPDEPFIE